MGRFEHYEILINLILVLRICIYVFVYVMN